MNRCVRAIACLLIASPLAAQSPCFDWASNFASQGIDNPQVLFSTVTAFKVWDDGSPAGQRLYAGGTFSSIGGVSAHCIAVWNGITWQPLGDGVHGLPGYLPFMGGVPEEVDSLCIHDEGSGPELYVGGAYTLAGGQAATGIAHWNGSTWTVIPGVEAEAIAMASYDDGSGPALYVSGYLYLLADDTDNDTLVWRGGAWHKFDPPAPTSFDFCVFDDGSGTKLYAAMGFLGVTRWTGSQWETVGGGFNNYVSALCVHDDGNGSKLYAGGAFTIAGGMPALRIARWDGVSWSALGAGIGTASPGGNVAKLISYPDGFGGAPKLIATGAFTSAGGSPANAIAAWDGSNWSALGSGLSGGVVRGLGVYDDGRGSGRDLYAGGMFTSAGGQPVSRFAKWEGCGGTGTPFCPGDGSLGTACPCGNIGSTGHGCASSTVSAGGLLAASGHPTPDTIVLSASDVKVNASSIFLQGNAMIANGVVFGDGVRCAGGSLLRLALKTAIGGNATYPESGDPSISARAAALGQPIGPSSSRIYQVYYRDSDLSFCASPAGNSWNVTNAMRIVW
jgi:hypothetical protein